MKNNKRFWSNFLFALLAFFVLVVLTLFLLEPTWLAFWQKKTTVSSSTTSQISSTTQQSQPLPKVSTRDWNLILVNREHPTDMTPPSLTKVEDIELDSRIADATQKFLAAIRAIEPQEALISGYRSKEAQTELFNDSIAETASANGISHEEAESEVRKHVQLPGASEHQTGLALDISVPSGQSDELADKIAALAPQYGFILRYPRDKTQITGVDFENWHYRYVGVESAKYMQANNLALEEYIIRLQAAEK